MSDEKDIKEQEEENNKAGSTENVEDSVQEETSSEPTMEDRFNEMNDRFLRLHAEFDNFRRRSNKEKLDIIANANADVLKSMLPVLDDYERAIQNNESVENLDGLKEGFKLIYNKFKHILDSNGLNEMKSSGESFDSELHEAIANVPAQKKKEKGKVMDTVEKGYYLNDKVIRYAKVVVGQ